MNTLAKYAISFVAAAFILKFITEAVDRLQMVTDVLNQIGR